MTRITTRDGTRLELHERGSGPPLLCLPGGPGRAAEYLEDLGGLDADRTLLLLDNRGTGGSELPADRASLAFPRLAGDVDDVRSALGLDRIDLLGHSAGAAIALTYAAEQSEHVSALVLVTPSGRAYGWPADDLTTIRETRKYEPWYAEAAEAAELTDTASPRLRSELDRVMRPFWYGRWDERAQAHAASADRQVSLRAAAGYPPAPGYDVAAARAALTTIEARTLIVLGERDALTGVTVGEQFRTAMPSAETAVIDNAGHFPWVDEPDRFSRCVNEFLLR